MADPALGRALEELRDAELLVPVRSSGGRALDAEGVAADEMRHGTDESGRFLAAYTTGRLLEEFGPPGTDHIRIRGDRLLALAAAAGERVVVDPGAPEQRELAAELVAALAGGPPVGVPAAPRPAPRPLRRGVPLPELSAPDEVPPALADALGGALEALPQVDRAWLLRRGEGWTIGVQQAPEATLSDFDEVRNRLHAVATEQLGTRRLLAVTDLRAAALRRRYAELADPFYERGSSRGILGRFFGG